MQVGSSVYGFTINIDLDAIGKSAVTGKMIVDKNDECNAEVRRYLAVRAVSEILEGNFGAKRSRFNPFISHEIVISTISDRVLFTVSPPVLKFNSFLDETIHRALAAAEDTGSTIDIVLWTPKDDVLEKLKEFVKSVKSEKSETKVQVHMIDENVKNWRSPRALVNKIIEILEGKYKCVAKP